MEMRKSQQIQELSFVFTLLKVKVEYLCQEVRERITSFHGLALFLVYLNMGFEIIRLLCSLFK